MAVPCDKCPLRKCEAFVPLTQEELAFKSGYHSTYISQLERGRKSPSLRAITSLAGALETSGSELLRRMEALLG